ncbi:hypothetical protein [Caulobacter sp. BE254]|uniref:hypothetical protein n=1 Tax=Caulobacter sp. BE254 TaxID=2817720 RepID=UPI0028567E1C|nr:hypothetical protein [Caulobacter sp. BE254]MDR7118323.1 hypothetical protein [Caulobacter sp. BE254]
MGILFVYLIVYVFVFGLIGAFIATNKGVSITTGVLLSALLGPIGLVVVALLNPVPAQDAALGSQIRPQRFDGGEACLENDRYRLWLVETYGVTRNDVLNVYAVNGEPFTTLDLALAHVDGFERLKLREQEAAAEAHEVLRQARAAALAQDERNSNTTTRIILIVLGVLVAAGVLALLFQSFAAL